MTLPATRTLRRSGLPPRDETVVLPDPVPVPVVVRPALPLAAVSLGLLALLLLSLCVYVTVVSGLFHARQQARGYAQLREDLANGVAPVGQTRDGKLLPPGTPVALLEVPGTGLREVVREGSSSRVLASGPGHRRDTVLPGQPGTAVVMGRRAAFGGPFADVGALRRGALVRVTTGQGRQEFRVVAVRRAGDPLPPAPESGARLTLVTAAGPPFVPTGVVRVDADLQGVAVPAPARAIASASLPASEQALAGDRGGVVALLLGAQLLLVAGCAAAWARVGWGPRQAWVVGVPVLTALTLGVAHSVALLLPNLL